MKFLRNRWIVFLLIIVVFVVVIGLSSKPDSPINFIYKAVSVPLQPVQRFFSGASVRISGAFNYFFNYESMEEKYQKIEEENDELKNTIRDIEHYRDENEELRSLLDIINSNKQYTYIAANVIVFDTDNWYNTFSIDKGSLAGVKLYDTVISSKGLVGKVVSVQPTSATIMSIVHPESTLVCRHSKTNARVTIRGTESLTTQTLCKMYINDETVDLAVGDIVETIESGGLYPSGLALGSIKEIIYEGNKRYAIVEPATDFRRLDKVLVINKLE